MAAYRDIAEQLLQRIAAGELAAGSTLPSVRAGARKAARHPPPSLAPTRSSRAPA